MTSGVTHPRQELIPELRVSFKTVTVRRSTRITPGPSFFFVPAEASAPSQFGLKLGVTASDKIYARLILRAA